MKKINVTSKLMSLILFFGMLSGFAQTIDVKGVVTDNSGEPLPGAEIVVVGTNHGVVSDFDGNYVIKAENGQKLRASYVGMKSKTVVVSGDKIDFVLQKDALGLDEVVVTAQTGIVTKRLLGTVIHSVKADELGERNVTNVSEALQGALPGARIMKNSGSASPSISIRLRGPSTITGSSDPLIMVDGIIVNNTTRSGIGSGASSDPLSDIDMSDIEKIEVLKGPAASAMYGSMASNGIIQIFTKKGKKGAPRVTIKSSINMNQIRKIKPINKSKYTWLEVNGVVERVPLDHERFDYQDYIFRKGIGYYNSVNVSGGTDWNSYSIGASLLNNEGIVRNSEYDRKNINVNFNQKLSEMIKMSVGVIYSKNESKEIPFASGSSFKYSPTQSILFADNATNPLEENGTYTAMGWQGNPYESVDKINATLGNDRIISNIGLKAELFDGFNLDYTLGYDYTHMKSKFQVPHGFGADSDGSLQFSNNSYGTLSSQFNVNYNYKLTENIKGQTGGGVQYLYNNRNYSYSGKPVLPIFGNLEVMDGANDIISNSSIYEYSTWGSYVQQHFTFYDKLHLAVGGRWDNASTFGKGQGAFYPKASGSLIVSAFDFWQQSLGKYINTFKIRGAWGHAGNITALNRPSIISTRYGTQYTPDGSYLGQAIYVPKSADGNRNIKPERTKETEFGFDASFLNGRIGLEFTYYNQDVEDLLFNRELAPSTGYSVRMENIGTMTNKGLEVSLKANPVNKKDFKWNIDFNYSQNKNTISNISGGWAKYGGYSTSIVANGHPLGIFYGYFYATDSNGNWVLDANGNPQRAQGHYEDKDNDGFPETVVQEFDSNGQPTGGLLKKIIGDPNPDYIFSVGNTFKYKNFSLRLVVESIQGFDVMSWDKRMAYSFRVNGTPGGASLFTGWEFAGWELDNNKRGWYGNRFRIYESFVEDGSFTKLREVSLSYNWKKPIKGLRAMNFTLSGSNLISWDHYWGYDPEVNAWGSANVTRSQDYGNIPVPKVYSFNVTLKF